ncbi:hypothetical protein [Streptomyces sp. NPDC060366]|uniref:hypothetical protein n=1 Tax=Streptomyces sp. NPDC060366 TaxID=3347105 RepID=UPI0036504FE9
MDDLSGKLGVEGDHETFAGASSGPRDAGPRQTAPGALGELLERTWSTWRKALREEEDQYTARVFTPFTREGKPVGAFELASGSGHGDGDDDGLGGIKALSRLGDHDPFGLSPFHLHALIRSTIRGAEDDTDDRWSERDRKRAAERALAALGERWRAGGRRPSAAERLPAPRPRAGP